jgi:hypothetical protein
MTQLAPVAVASGEQLCVGDRGECRPRICSRVEGVANL